MFSHVVIFWTKPEIPHSTDALIAGAENFLGAGHGAIRFGGKSSVANLQ